MKAKIPKLTGAFFILIICLMIFPHAEIKAQANGFVFSREDTMTYMYRFSFDNPGELTGRKTVAHYRKYTVSHMLFANRPWIFCFQRSPLGPLLSRIDTATGEEMAVDITGSYTWDYAAVSYDKSRNAVYIMVKVAGSEWQPDYKGTPVTYLESISISGKGGVHGESPVRVGDTTVPVTFSIGSDGFGYSVNTRGALRKINLATGKCDVIFKLKGDIKEKVKSSAFNPVSGVLYLLAQPDSMHTELIELDIKSGKSKVTATWAGTYTYLAISGDVYPPPPRAPELISPLGHLENFGPLLEWKPVDGATGYFLNYRIMYDGLDHPWWKWKDVKEPSYQLGKGEFDSGFPNYWWVAAYDSTGLGYFSKSGAVGFYVDEK